MQQHAHTDMYKANSHHGKCHMALINALVYNLYICAIKGKFITKAAAEAAVLSQARLFDRALAKLLNSGYNSNDYDNDDVNDGTVDDTGDTNGTNVPNKGPDDVSTNSL
jgi:hypothetical protein